MNASPGAGDAPGAQVPTCYRHPDRETYVRCRRCDRPICPDCMRDASVGFHCVSCVAESGKRVREARTVFGGRVTDKPYVTWVLLGLMVLGFLAQSVNGEVTGLFAMWGPGVLQGEWYRLVTAAFLHGGTMHLLFNGFAMYMVGVPLERRLGISRYAALWVLSAVGGGVLTYLLAFGTPTVGASGAVFGLFGAALVMGRRLELDTRSILVLLGLNLVITFLVPGISWTGHIGGLLAGLALGAAYTYLPRSGVHGDDGRRARTLMHVGATIGCVLVLAAGVLLGTLLVMG